MTIQHNISALLKAECHSLATSTLARKLWLSLSLLAFSGLTFSQVGDLLWEENFDQFNSDYWNIDIGDGCAQGICGWGNQELQSYEQDNVYIDAAPGEPGNNALVLEARRENSGSLAFTSGKIQSKNKVAVQYGMIEYRVLIPDVDTGLWPAVWVLGTSTSPWPRKGEIDMMEMGHSAAQREGAGHPGAAINNYTASNVIRYAEAACVPGNESCAASAAWQTDNAYVALEPLTNRFVTYRMYWTSQEIRFTVFDNGVEYDMFEQPVRIPEDDPDAEALRAPFYLLMNLAVGGNFTDALTNDQVTAPLPGKMYVDYIRVYQYNGLGSVALGGPAPETGTFGVFTDTTETTSKLVAGQTSDIYVWDPATTAGETEPAEGANVLAWSPKANSWFGGGIQARQPVDLSNFSEGHLKFKIKFPANTGFRIGITDTYTNENWIDFPAGEERYGMVRDGEWTEVSIPVSDLRGPLIALQSVSYAFAILSLDPLSGSDFQFAVDDIRYEGGGDPVILDSDNDGVPDTADLCPGTPDGTSVDTSGCPLNNDINVEVVDQDGFLAGGPDSAFPGHTLYVKTKNSMHCGKRCQKRYVPLLVSDGIPSEAGGLGKTTLDDGSEQVTYDGRPLYFFKKDLEAGEARGEKGKFVAVRTNQMVPTTEVMVINDLLVGGPASTNLSHSLYISSREDCNNWCNRNYLPLLVTDGVTNGIEGLAEETLSDGRLQATYNGDRLYFYKKDKRPGQQRGEKKTFRLARIAIIETPDTDGDGVEDSIDECPDTPPGTDVDANGCPLPLDSDNDGVTDDQDLCPDTSAGITVDTNGCPLLQNHEYITLLSNGDLLLSHTTEIETVVSLMFLRINGVQSEPALDVIDNGDGTYTHQYVLSAGVLAEGDQIEVRFFYGPLTEPAVFLPGPAETDWSPVYNYSF